MNANEAIDRKDKSKQKKSVLIKEKKTSVCKDENLTKEQEHSTSLQEVKTAVIADKEKINYKKSDKKKRNLEGLMKDLTGKSVFDIQEKNDNSVCIEINTQKDLKSEEGRLKRKKTKDNTETSAKKAKDTIEDGGRADDKHSKHVEETNNEPAGIYKLKISKNSIKLKNIGVMYPSNIGVTETKSNYHISFKDRKAASRDLKMNEKHKYFDDKLIITNFSYKENEEFIKEFLSEYGDVTDVNLEKNSENVFTGKAIVTFSSSVKINKELKLNNKILRVERIRKVEVNDRRIFIGRIDMNLSIMTIRKAIKATGAKLTDIRIRFEKETHKNIGYGHLTFKSREDATKFERCFNEVKKVLGPHSFYEYSKEKNLHTFRK